MIFSGILYLIGAIFQTFNSFLPVWNPWPTSVERAFTLLGQNSYWLDPWIPMHTFWQIIMFDSAFFITLLPFVIFSRSLRLKIFNKN